MNNGFQANFSDSHAFSCGQSRCARHVRGFTLIEVMITVAIVAILTAIALPSYRNYVLRGYLVDATNQLASAQAQMERYYQDNRTYASFAYTSPTGTVTLYPPCDARAYSLVAPPQQGKFQLTCGTQPAPSSSAYSLVSTGTLNVTGFVYTVDNQNNKTTTVNSAAFPGWQSSATCWVTKSGANSC